MHNISVFTESLSVRYFESRSRGSLLKLTNFSISSTEIISITLCLEICCLSHAEHTTRVAQSWCKHEHVVYRVPESWVGLPPLGQLS